MRYFMGVPTNAIPSQGKHEPLELQTVVMARASMDEVRDYTHWYSQLLAVTGSYKAALPDL